MNRWFHNVRDCSAWLILLSTAAICTGCGGASDAPVLLPVTGRVTVENAPLEGLGVTFRADESRGNTSGLIPAGTTDSDGNYELQATSQSGASPGWYKVVITPPTPPMTGGEAPQVGPPPFAAKYSDFTTTDLAVEVKEDAAPGDYDFNLMK